MFLSIEKYTTFRPKIHFGILFIYCNNDVPYHYAITNKTYLMIYRVAIDKNGLNMYNTYERFDGITGEPYEEYYDKK